jgi:hypothetical protein
MIREDLRYLKNIIQYSYKKGKIIDVENLDVREGLFVEATKLI